MSNIPYGYCHCGCGELAPLHANNKSTKGYVKDEPRKYIYGHSIWGRRNLEQKELLCRKCQQLLPASEFYTRIQKSGIRNYHTYCKQCVGKYNRELGIKAIYGITIKQYNEMIQQQNNCCAICLESFENKDKYNQPNIDHCHQTGKIRGILCVRCNVAIGQLKEDVTILEQAILYLKRKEH